MLQVSDNYNNPALVIGHLSVNKMAAAHLLHPKRAASLLILSLLLDEEGERPKKRNRKISMRNWISRREDRGVYHQLVKELEVGDSVAYKEFFRMTKQQFSVLVEKILPLVEKKEQPLPINTVRATIKPDERFAVTLRFLATGEIFIHSSTHSEFLVKQFRLSSRKQAVPYTKYSHVSF